MLKKCLYCGTEFNTENSWQKYCSHACTMAEKMRRQNIRRAAEREKRAAEASKRFDEAQALTAEQQAELAKKRKSELLKRVSEGDPLAIMENSERFSADYWKAYRDYELQQMKLSNFRWKAYVNEIPVTDEDFVDKVLISIAEQGCIFKQLSA